MIELPKKIQINPRDLIATAARRACRGETITANQAHLKGERGEEGILIEFGVLYRL
jgi:hypothetical protein